MLPQKIIDFIRSANHKQSFTKGSTIIHQGGSLDYVYLIAEGLVSLHDVDKYGYARTAVIYPKDQVFPVSWLLIEPPAEGARFNYQALTKVVCYVIPRNKIRQFLKENPELCHYLTDMMTKGFINAVGRIYNLQKTNVGERIDYVLNFLAQAYGKVNTNGVTELDNVFTHQNIADFAGLSREAVSHQLAKPRYKKLVWKQDKKLFINTKLLSSEAITSVYRISREKIR